MHHLYLGQVYARHLQRVDLGWHEAHPDGMTMPRPTRLAVTPSASRRHHVTTPLPLKNMCIRVLQRLSPPPNQPPKHHSLCLTPFFR